MLVVVKFVASQLYQLFYCLRNRAPDQLELVGWAGILLLLPIQYSIGEFRVDLDLFAIPLAAHLARKFGRTGFILFALFGSSLAWPALYFGIYFIDYYPNLWIYVTGLVIGWLISDTQRFLRHVFGWSPLALGALILLLPQTVAFEVTPDSGQLEQVSFRIALAPVVYAVVALWALAARPMWVPICFVFVASLVGQAFSLFSSRGQDSLVGENWAITFGYGIGSLGSILSAAIVYFSARYLASFDRQFPKALPGRFLPSPFAAVGLVLFLVVTTHWPLLHRAIIDDFLGSHYFLGVTPSTVVFLLTCFLAGFWLRLWGSFLVSASVVVFNFLLLEFDEFSLDVVELVLPFLLGWQGQLWRAHTRGDVPFRFHAGWFRYGNIVAAIVTALLVLPHDALRTAVEPVFIEEEHFEYLVVPEESAGPNLLLAFGPPAWLAIMLGTYSAIGRGGFLRKAEMKLEGLTLSLLNIALLCIVLLTLWSPMAETFTELRQLLGLLTLEGIGALLSRMDLVIIVTLGTWGAAFALSVLFGSLLGAIDASQKILGRSRFHLFGQRSDLPESLGFGGEAPQLGLQSVRSLGLALILTPLTLLTLILFVATGLVHFDTPPLDDPFLEPPEVIIVEPEHFIEPEMEEQVPSQEFDR